MALAYAVLKLAMYKRYTQEIQNDGISAKLSAQKDMLC